MPVIYTTTLHMILPSRRHILVTVYVAHEPKNMNHLEYIHLNKLGAPVIKETSGEKYMRD